MKIRIKLFITILLSMVLPIVFCIIFTVLIMHVRIETINNEYDINVNPFGFIFDPYNNYDKTSHNDYIQIADRCHNKPSDFENRDSLERINAELEKKHSFIIVKKDNTVFYSGDVAKYTKIGLLPVDDTMKNNNPNGYFIDPLNSLMIRGIDFYYANGVKGHIYLVTDLKLLKSEWRISLSLIIILYITFLILTTITCTMWINKSFVKPLNTLQDAAVAIGDGNLGESLPKGSDDELGQLMDTMDDMRARLKEMTDERLDYEESTREMITNMAHDIRTPLTSIKGYTEGIIDGIARTDEKRHKYLQIIYTKANDISSLVDEMSLFVKVEQNTIVYNFTNIDLNELLINIMNINAPDLEMKGIRFIFDSSVPAGTFIMGDQEQLRRVVNNIIGNSVKYNDSENRILRIHVETYEYEDNGKDPAAKASVPSDISAGPSNSKTHTQADLAASDPRGCVRIMIGDNGPGVAPDNIGMIFDRFYRADASRNSSKKGSGLGLSIVAKIIHDHGGKVWAENDPEGGLDVNFLLKVI
ncbi:MAG: HAMP domain-containing sensor histidine kinase [Lachnospiraceae bacterium]|jgi:signal transduction histidine kinase|nr:HAMP domain-containing sensor histidine kinase [Lachnospiraceae bacterium]MEE3460682.1 HAMP domain-containing sensor histidine kinase [Lachnospiraceae bacterium]